MGDKISSEYDQWRKAVKGFRLLMYIGGIASLAFILTAIVFKSLYASEQIALTNETLDSILFESVLLVCGAFFGSAIIGVLFDRYSSIFSEREELLRDRYESEGILRVFESDNDPKLLEFLADGIVEMKTDLVAVGLGLGLFAKNRNLLNVIGSRLKKDNSFKVTFIFPTATNNGLRNRISEEKQVQSSYDENWASKYPREINAGISDDIPEELHSRVSVVYTEFFPLMTIIRLDDLFLFYSYGSPDIRGAQSPWILVRAESDDNTLGSFVKKVCEFYERRPSISE